MADLPPPKPAGPRRLEEMTLGLAPGTSERIRAAAQYLDISPIRFVQAAISTMLSETEERRRTLGRNTPARRPRR